MAKTLEQKILTKFNQITGLLLRGSNEANTNKIKNLLAMIGEDDTLNYAEDWYKANPNPNGDTAMVKFYAYAIAEHSKGHDPISKVWKHGNRLVNPTRVTEERSEPKVPVKEKTEEEKPVSTAESQATGFLNQLGDLLVNTVAKEKTDEIVERVKKEAVAAVEQFVHETYGELPKKVIVEVGGDTREVHGITHEKFESTLKKVARHTPVFLVGGAGSGKNVLAEQIAEALGVPFYFSSAVSQEYKITGYSDANGVFSSPPFYKAWTEGGVFLFDEIDASNPEVFVTFNSALSNGYMDFPSPIGNVQKNPNFYAMAAGNTYGTGADYQYVGRNVLDAATRNRFYVMDIGYDKRIEEYICDGDNDLLNFCHKFRKAVRRNGIQAIFSYRNLHMLKDAENDGEPLYEVIDESLTSGMRYDDLNIINVDIMGCGRWSDAFGQLVSWKKGLLEA